MNEIQTKAAVTGQEHPAVKEHISMVNNMARELDELRAQNQQLRNDLEVERRHCTELQHTIDREREDRDFFQRYAVEVNTHLSHIEHAAHTALERAKEVATHEPPRVSEPSLPLLPTEPRESFAELTKKLAERADGYRTRKDAQAD